MLDRFRHCDGVRACLSIARRRRVRRTRTVLHFGRVALAALVFQHCQLVEDAASVVVELLRSVQGNQGYFCVKTNVQNVSVIGEHGATCKHETLCALIVGCSLLFTYAGEQVSHLSDPS